ncbi:MAG: hypothetical protein EHM20_03040 [Alphaproteobacteria bacterium]|nr:MAG: hypothetical protein EHM20_03040 [Alphaproteobacteria bacterium]
MKKRLVFFGLNLLASSSFGASYDTLPKGIDMFAMKHVITSKIDSKYDDNQQNNSLSIKENLTSGKLESINSAMKTYFEELKTISPEAYNQFSLGEFQAEAHAEGNAQGVGLARGITDRLTFYGSLPIYHIKTNVTFRQSQKSNVSAIQTTLQNAPTSSALSGFVKQLTLQLPDTNEQVLQSLIVNYYDYKALGTWEKDALGDAEIGMIYRLTNFSDKGLAIAGGVILPTGDADDPDSLQDVATGDGQYDAFVESMAGISFFNNTIALDLKTRFTHQFATKKILRASDDSTMPLTKNKEAMTEKLGNKIDGTLSMTINATSWFNFNSSLIISETKASQYGATDPRVKNALEQNTSNSNQWARIGIGFSSIELYKKKKMDIPFEISLTAQRLLNAKNAANYDRADLDFRLYF